MDHDMTATAVNGGDDTLEADGVRQRPSELDVHHSVAKEGRTDNHGVGAAVEDRPRAFDAANAAANAAWKPAADHRDKRPVVSAASGGVEIDELHAGKLREPYDPWLWIGCFYRKRLTLHELDDASVLQVD
jgi:hypothetical protein